MEIDIHYVAQLARLELAVEEEARLRQQLGQVLTYVAKLQELATHEVEPMAHAVPLVNVLRPDVPVPSLPQTEALRNAPAQSEGLFVVPKIVE